MKKALILLLISLSLATSSCIAGERTFKKFPGNMRVNTLYISPTAVKLGMTLGGGQVGQFKKLIKKLDSIEIMSTDRHDSHSALNQECKSVVEKNNMDLILNAADSYTKTNIYIGKLLNDNEIQDIIIESQESSSYNVVYIKGIINADELMKSYNSDDDEYSDNNSTANEYTSSGRTRKTPRAKQRTPRTSSTNTKSVDSHGCEY